MLGALIMQPAELQKKLNGVISFPCTPFKKDLSLDLDGLRKNLRALLKHPICAIVAPAGTGEIHVLSPAGHREAIHRCGRERHSRLSAVLPKHGRRRYRRVLQKHCRRHAARDYYLQPRLGESFTVARGKTRATDSQSHR